MFFFAPILSCWCFEATLCFTYRLAVAKLERKNIRAKQSGPEEDRTPDPLLAKQVLYQTELQAPNRNGGPE